LALVGAAIVIALLGVVCLGAGVGRFHVVPVGAQARDVHMNTSSIAIVTPEPTRSLHAGDVITGRFDGQAQDALYRVHAVDSWTHDVYGVDAQGHLAKFKIGAQTGVVSRTIPFVGTPYGWLAGTAQGLALLFVAMLLVVKATMQRQARRDIMGATRRFGRWWWTRLGAAIVAAVGVLSLTAGATFTGTASVNQGAITTGHMAISIGGAGATNRLTLGASGIAPGDRMQRAVDVAVDGSTTSGIMSGMTLAVTASPSSALNTDATNGLRIFVQDCRTSGGNSGWSESGSTPAYSYSCTKGGGGAWNDNLNSSPTDDPTAVPSAGTCATSSGGTSSYRALSEMATPYTLVNLPTLSASTTLHLVITMCFPTAAGDSFQDTTSTLTFAFAGVQRSGTSK
jgi:hypothetical protein